MKLFRKLLVLLILIAAAVMLYGPVNEYFRPSKEGGMPVTVTIPQGASVSDIAGILQENGLIEHKWVFQLKAKLSSHGSALRYGTFELHDNMSLSDIIYTLATKGDAANTFTLTIPEGYSAEKIAVLLEEKQICTAEDFLDALENGSYSYDFIQDIPSDKPYNYKLQGFLFPSTYEFYNDATPNHIIDTMLGEFDRQYQSIDKGKNKKTLYDIVTMASLIEREARLPEERTTIAGVIQNRLDIDMLLQVDATVIYAISDGLYDVDTVYYKDLETNSPYNTYRFKGLPAGPICSPGLDSLKAAIFPEQHEYYYYHTDEVKKDGSHIFTKDFSSHQNTMQ